MALMVDDPGRSASSPGRVRSLHAGADSVVVSRPGQTGRMEVWSTLENRLSSGGRGVPPPSGPTGRGELSAALGAAVPIDELSHNANFFSFFFFIQFFSFFLIGES